MIAARKVREVARALDPAAGVYLFGSAVRGKLTALSDIDILILTERTDLKYEIMIKVYKNVEDP